MTRILLVRHGESEWNAQGRLHGHGGGGLSARGHAEAAATARYLAKTVAQVDCIARSDLPRVAETAEPFEALVAADVVVDERLREIDVGTWSGLTWDEIAESDPATLAAWRGGQDVRRGGGETFAGLRTRVWAALLDIAHTLAPSAGTAVVFTHGGPIRVAVAAALDLPPLGERLLVPVANCSVTELDITDGTGLLRSYNRFDHLDL